MSAKPKKPARTTRQRTPTGGRLVQLPIDQLKKHPQQDTFFDPLDPAPFQALLDDIKKNGLRNPIVVVKDENGDFIILDGHNRLAVAKALGWTHVLCLVRDDLIAAKPDQRLDAYLSYNLNRRQLSTFDRARIAWERWKALKAARSTGAGTEGAARDAIAKMLGVSARNVARYLNLYQAPREIQRAVEQGHLKLTLGERVRWLRGTELDALMNEFKAATPEMYNAVVANNVATTARRTIRKPATKTVIRAITKWADLLPTLNPLLVNCHGPKLMEYKTQIRALRQFMEAVAKQSKHTGGDLAALFARRKSA